MLVSDILMSCTLLLHSYPLQTDLSRLSAIVRLSHLLEPGVVQSLLCSDTLGRVIDEDLLEQIDKVLEESVVARDDVLYFVSAIPKQQLILTYREVLHGLDKASGAAGCVGGGVIKLEPLEIPMGCK